MIRRPPRSTQSRSSAASDVYKRQQPSQGAARPRQPLARSPVALPHQGYVLRRNHPRRQPQPRPGTAHRAEKTSRLRKRLTKGVSLAVLALLVSVAYLVWRATQTLDLAVWWLSVPLLLLEVHAVVGLALFTFSLWDVCDECG